MKSKYPIKKSQLLLLTFIAMVCITACQENKETLLVELNDGQSDVIYLGKKRLEGIDLSVQNKKSERTDADDQMTWMIDDYQANIKSTLYSNCVGFSVSIDSAAQPKADEFFNLSFENISGFKEGMSIWRYKPWNSWTKPIKISNPAELQDWDIQFFYWQYEDGVYGAALPLSGNGYRTTIGNVDRKFGVKSKRQGGDPINGDIPQLIVGFGNDPYELFDELFQNGLKSLGKEENLIANKSFPARLDYIGWCTWNSSDMGRDLNEQHVLSSVKSFQDSAFQLGWVIIDDGWFNHTGSQLNSIYPNTEKFPDGFKSMNTQLKQDFGIKHVGLWHALNGYWNGINPDSEVGTKYQSELFSWNQRESVQDPESPTKTYHFIKPNSNALYAFYNDWHQWMVSEGFSFVKVDNQLVTERMSVDNYPIFTLSEKLHQALNQSVFENFDGGIVNCMDMTAEAYLNFGKTAVARTVEDYFPAEDGGVGYELEKGGAAAHVIMALYNSLYFGQMAYPDFDMFQSHNPDAYFHAIARAINNGPVYLTDKPGLQNFDVLRPLVYSDGQLIRADLPLRPTKDCLFQLQDANIFKAFSRVNQAGLLGVWNMADAEKVSGTVTPEDVKGLEGDAFICYEYFSRKAQIVNYQQKIDVQLGRMGYQLYSFIPITQGIAPIGLTNKYNSPSTINSVSFEPDLVKISVKDWGIFKMYSDKTPKKVTVDGKHTKYNYLNGIVEVKIEEDSSRHNFVIEVKLNKGN